MVTRRNICDERPIVRIESIEVKNFKNVGYGYLDFENTKKEYKSSILGLYGQNGSGKTALIDALELLRLALSGRVRSGIFRGLHQCGERSRDRKIWS